MDETLVGLYRKALNRHLKGDLLCSRHGIEWLSNAPECNYDKVPRDDKGEDETLSRSNFRTFSKHANKKNNKRKKTKQSCLYAINHPVAVIC